MAGLTDQLELVASVIGKLTDLVELAASVYNNRLRDLVELVATVSPKLLDSVLLIASVKNQAYASAGEATMLAPEAEITIAY